MLDCQRYRSTACSWPGTRIAKVIHIQTQVARTKVVLVPDQRTASQRGVERRKRAADSKGGRSVGTGSDRDARQRA